MRATITFMLLLTVFSLVLANETSTETEKAQEGRVTIYTSRIVKPETERPLSIMSGMGTFGHGINLNTIGVSQFGDDNVNQIRNIYNQYLEDDLTLEGIININTTFTDGSLSSATVTSNTTRNDELANEILSAVREWIIEESEGISNLCIGIQLQRSSNDFELPRAYAINPSASFIEKSDEVTSDMVGKITSYVRASGESIKSIYERYLTVSSMCTGWIIVSLTLTDGIVSSANLAMNTTGDGALANNILWAVKEWHIEGVEGTVTFEVPFLLKRLIPMIPKAQAVYPDVIVIEESYEITSDMVDKITSYIDARGGQIKRIYERHLADDPGIAGRIIICMLMVDGKVTDALIEQDTIGNIELAAEISSIISSWQIGGVKGFIRVNAVFVLQPK
ncbi:hypothetical protein K8R78_05400 [bacterium]|nr:hypothetical protein [bacterium]